MSSKYLHGFSEENSELQKQIGCMTGIFQMFDRHHLLPGRRLSNHKRLPSGHVLINNGSTRREHNGHSPQIILDKNPSKSIHENHRISMESSRISFSSSSCTSSFSSLECNKSTQQEPPSTERTIFPERSSMSSPNLKSSNTDNKPSHHEPRSQSLKASPQPGRRSLEFRDIVKDSIYKDACSLSVKTSTEEEGRSPALRHRDSPRPMPLSKGMDGSYVIGIDRKPKVPVDLYESLRVLVKLKETPCYFSEASEPPRSSYEAKDSSLYPVARETPRFSYDGRERSRKSVDSRENRKPASKLKEIPRLSLDSRSSAYDSKLNPIMKDWDSNRISQGISPPLKIEQETGSHSRLPSVVAKLMGLEDLPNLSLIMQEPVDMPETNTNKNVDAINGPKNVVLLSNPSKTAQNSKEDWHSHSSKSSLKDPVTPRLKSHDPVMKPISNSRVPIETAPWRQQERVHDTPTAGFRHWGGNLKQQNESVYSEIEKRLKELELHQSNKDPGAFKHKLDVMQAKGLLESKKGEDQYSKVLVQKKNTHVTPTESDESLSTRQITVSLKGNATERGSSPPIVIMKPAKSIKKSDVSVPTIITLEGLPKLRISDSPDKKKSPLNNRMTKDQTPKASFKEPTNRFSLSMDKKSNDRAEDNNSQKAGLRSMQNSARLQQIQRDNSSSKEKNMTSVSPRMSSVSPRLQQRKLEADKKSHPPHPSSDSSKSQRQSDRQASDSASPRNKLRRKPTQAQKSTEQLHGRSNLNQLGDEISVRSDSSISLASQVDVEKEVTSADRSAEMNNVFHQQGGQSPSGRAAKNAASVMKQKDSWHNLNKNVSTVELETMAPKQPNPMSVLDASFYQDDLPPSPLKKLSNAYKDNESQTSHNCYNLKDMDDNTSCSEINHRKLEKIENLVQKLRELSPTIDESATTDHMSSLCETQNPDHQYVSEILLASGLLMKDLTSRPMGSMPIQLHPSGHPINPDLFLVLEQTKSGWFPKPEAMYETKPKHDAKKLHRKLLFDMVNEILVQMLDLTSSPFCISKLTSKVPSGQHLLKELCFKIDELQADSLKIKSSDEGESKSDKDVLRQSDEWEDFGREVPCLVLEIERLIFKDLIDEVLSGKFASRLQAKASWRRRQLFTK